METEDGCTWSISWFRDASAFFVDVWDWAPDDEVGGTADPGPDCTCPFPLLGVYDTLETVEGAMGMKIPARMREELLADARRSPIREEDSWGRIWATELYRTAGRRDDLQSSRARMGRQPVLASLGGDQLSSRLTRSRPRAS